MNNQFFFFVGLAFILTHAMDAVKAREWAISPAFHGWKIKLALSFLRCSTFRSISFCS